MELPDTDSLRALAPNWNLAGDKKLLDVLKNIHQNIIQKCEQTNVQLEQMQRSLDDADICLQNVNNRFVALSNRQFVECRVYDDDIDVTPKQTISEIVQIPEETPESEIAELKRSIEVIERMHSPVRILNDSDSETDSDDDVNRLVYKPKDLYAHRPLPYIIGSQAWKSKWHAGLLVEDSDSDGSVSKREVEEYSDTDEDVYNTQTDKLQVPDGMDSSSSPSVPRSVSPPRRPADVAAEIARRLAGPYPQIPQTPIEEFKPPTPTTRKIYKPQQPITGTIFSDEPPPLEQSTDESDTDIFAELHKNGSNADNNRVYNNVNPVEDLFGQNDMFGTMLPSRSSENPKLSDKPKPSVFEDDSEPDLFAENPPKPENIVKRPAGGISLFGNQGTESIGAAILDRNRRSDENDNIKQETNTKNKERDARNENNNESTNLNTGKNILKDIFAKPEIKTKNQEIPKKSEEKKPVVRNKIDLFSDNIFDDIDDIFTTSVIKTKPTTNQKSIFEDDLFTDIAKNESVNITKSNDKKSIFDDDDDLFNDVVIEVPEHVTEESKINSLNRITKDFDDITHLAGDSQGKEKNQADKININEAYEADKIKLFSGKADERSIKSDLKKSDSEESKTNTLSIDKKETLLKNQQIKTTNKRKEIELFDSDEEIFHKKASEKESIADFDSVINKPFDTKDQNIIQEILQTSKNATEIEKITITDTETDNSCVESVVTIKDVQERKTASKNNIEQKNENRPTDKSPKNSLFDSDEDIFITKITEKIESNKIEQPSTSISQRVFDKDSIKHQDNRIFASEEALFTDQQIHILPVAINKHSIFDSDEDLFKNQTKENLPKTDKSTEQLTTNKKVTHKVADKSESEATENVSYNLPKTDKSTEQLTTNKKVTHNVADKSESEATENVSYLVEKNQKRANDDSDEVFSTEVKNLQKKSILTNTIGETKESQSNKFESNAAYNINEISKKEISKEDNTTKSLSTNTTEDDIVYGTHSINNEQILGNEAQSNTKQIKVSDNLIISEINESNTLKSPSIFDDDDYDLLKTSEISEKQSDILRTTKIVSDHEKAETESETNHNESQNVLNKVENTEKLKSVSIFDDDVLDDNLFSPKTNKFCNSSRTESKIEQEMNKESITQEQKDDLYFQQQSSNSDIFTDIFADQPPVFEKPKESKKSKNVNALFDDDSDDEALFFKKNDPTLDEQPDLNISNSKFDLFLDEPPSVDMSEDSENLKDKIESPQIINTSANQNNERYETVKSPKEDIEEDVNEINRNETLETVNTLSHIKTVGKLKPMNININVNTLLPGASPKKQKPDQTISHTTNNEEIDGQGASSNVDNDRTVTFDENLELLDNKISKDRAKIQIKRRPSTRRARKEAARKSGIDYGDATNPIANKKLPEVYKETIGKSSYTTHSSGVIIGDGNTDENDFNAEVDNIKQLLEVTALKDDSEVRHLDVNKGKDINKGIDSSALEKDKQSSKEKLENKSVTSKIVYILNDEDIFTPDTKNNLTKTEDIEKKGLNTLGQMYSGNKTTSTCAEVDANEILPKRNDDNPKASLFDDLSDDESELFGAKKVKSKGHNTYKYKTDKESITTRIVKKEKVRGSLFSDDEDCNDLFGVQTKRPEATPQPQTSREKDAAVKQKETETVFVDPLSQLVGDEL